LVKEIILLSFKAVKHTHVSVHKSGVCVKLYYLYKTQWLPYLSIQSVVLSVLVNPGLSPHFPGYCSLLNESIRKITYLLQEYGDGIMLIDQF
jgi:hypothetical protein